MTMTETETPIARAQREFQEAEEAHRLACEASLAAQQRKVEAERDMLTKGKAYRDALRAANS